MNNVKLTLYFKDRTEVIKFKTDNEALNTLKSFCRETKFNSGEGFFIQTNTRVIKFNWQELIAVDLEYRSEITLFQWILNLIFGD